jgi:hypothetical protein
MYMSEPMPLTRMGMPERRMLPVVTVGPYVLLALLTVATVAIKHSAAGSLRIDLALCGLSVAWIAWMFTLHPPGGCARARWPCSSWCSS